MEHKKRYEDEINFYADQEGIPRAVAQAMIDTENGGRDADRFLMEAWGGGSYGLSMVTLATAREYGFTGQPDELREPRNHLTFGFKYLRAMYTHALRLGAGEMQARMRDYFDRTPWAIAVAAYNAGPDLSPWPEVHIDRFLRYLAKWQERYAGEPAAPTDSGRDGGADGAITLGGPAGPAREVIEHVGDAEVTQIVDGHCGACGRRIVPGPDPAGLDPDADVSGGAGRGGCGGVQET